MTFVFSVFATVYLTYTMWIRREDTMMSIERFKIHIEKMKNDSQNLTNWNKNMNESIIFFEKENKELYKFGEQYSREDVTIRTELSELQ